MTILTIILGIICWKFLATDWFDKSVIIFCIGLTLI